jgi:subtilisin family serine protease
MRKASVVLLLLAAASFAANPFRPARSGSFTPQSNPGDFQVGFWDSPRFDPLSEGLPLPGELKIDEYPGDGSGYYLVQFAGPAYGMHIDRLQRAGGEFVGFHSRSLAFVKMDRAVAGEVAALSFVRWVGVYQPGYKLWSRTLAGDGFGRVSVALFYPEDIEAARAELAAMGLAVVRSGVSENMKVIEVDCSRRQLAAIARRNWVFSIEEWHPSEPENDKCQWVVQDWTANQRNVWSKGIFGMDEILGYSDTGLDVDHWAFYDPNVVITDTGEFPTHRKVVVYKHYPPASGVGDQNGHGTHVGGTMAGNDSANGGASVYDGHSKQARIVHLSPIPQPPGSDFTVPLNMITNDLRNPELRPHTIGNSWWTGTMGQYTNAAATFDMFSWKNKDIQTIKSCGNQGHSGSYMITEPGNAKSILAAASLLNGTSATSLSSYSSSGPGPDGRIKPDIAVPGEDIYSVETGTQNGYVAMSGTSMASPATNGCVGLCRSYLRKGYYPSGTATAADTWGYVSSAILRAMILVSADPNVESYVVPSDHIGWGRIDLDSVLFFAGDTRKLLAYDDTTGLSTGDYVEFAFDVFDSTMPLRAAVVWTDTAAASGADPALINNLDCELTAPGADFYKGDLYTSGQSTLNPSGAFDSKNPLEMFRVNQPDSGRWLLRVAAQNVVTARQPYAVVITGPVQAAGLHDVGVRSIIAPPDSVDSGTVVTPRALVKNYGTYDETLSVRMYIGPGYADSVEVALAAGATDTVVFATSTADSVGAFSISCVTALATDELAGNDTLSDTVVVWPGSGIQEQGKLPTAFALDRARPTPFSGKTSIRLSIPRLTVTGIGIYSATGALVRVLSAPQPLTPNTYSLTWDGRDDRGATVPRGVYYCRMEAGEFRDIKKLVKLE